MRTSNVNNQGIAHVAFDYGKRPFCRSERAHIVVPMKDAHNWGRLCIRCEKQMLKYQTKKAAH